MCMIYIYISYTHTYIHIYIERHTYMYYNYSRNQILLYQTHVSGHNITPDLTKETLTYIYIYIYIHTCIVIYIYIYVCHRKMPLLRLTSSWVMATSMPSPPIKSLDFRGFDSSTILNLRGGIPRPIGIS